jgi:acetyl-CoA carboxylase biotin carboxyl carrier protein
MLFNYIYYVKHSQSLTLSYVLLSTIVFEYLKINLDKYNLKSFIFIKSNFLINQVNGGSIVSEITAPMGGKVLEVKVKPGDSVSEDDEVLILEAMKMELPVVAPAAGTVKEVKCSSGDTVEADAVLITLD